MRWLAPLCLVSLGCTFDASGVGAAPGVTEGGGITTVPASSSVTSGGVDGSIGGTTMSEGTQGLSGSDALTGGMTTTTEPGATTEPGTTTAGMTTTTEPGTTTAMGSSGGCMEVPGYVDMDGDGHGDPMKPTMGCIGDAGFATNNIDCDDAQPGAWAGHPENCDGIDNDCDGKIDEYDGSGNNDECGGCQFKTRDGRLYYFCDAKKNWLDARVYCKYFGLDLVIDTDVDEHKWMVLELGIDLEMRWIGGEDFSTNKYTWVDGVQMPQQNWPWGGGEPNNSDGGLDADCVGFYVSGLDRRWGDFVCSKSQKFICEGPVM